MTGKGTQTRHAILDRASVEAARLGLAGLTIGSLAKQLEMSKSGLFAHFNSKEALQIAVLEFVAEAFTDEVVRAALKKPRGEARVRALFDGWIEWIVSRRAASGCLFVAAAVELDDQPGPARRCLVEHQRDLLEFVSSVATTAVKHGDFRPDLDAEQFAMEVQGIILAYHLTSRLLEDPTALLRARRAFERLIADARV